MDQKVKLLLANGAVEVWLVYLAARSVWVHRPGSAREFRDVLTTDLIPGLRIDLATLFA